MKAYAPRQIKMILHRKNKKVWERQYATISNACKRATELSFYDCKVGDVFEFIHNDGLGLLGTMKIYLHGRVEIVFTEYAITLGYVPGGIND